LVAALLQATQNGARNSFIFGRRRGPQMRAMLLMPPGS
jgi:hypothetical protein